MSGRLRDFFHTCVVYKPKIVYIFFQNAAPGQKILESPSNLIYLLVTVNVISMSVWLTDQNGKLLDLRGEKLTISFHLREREQHVCTI